MLASPPAIRCAPVAAALRLSAKTARGGVLSSRRFSRVNSWPMTKSKTPAKLVTPKPIASEWRAFAESVASASLPDLIGRVVRKLHAMGPELLHSYEWDDSETLNVSEINAAAKKLGLGPIFEIGHAPDWGSAPNLPP